MKKSTEMWATGCGGCFLFALLGAFCIGGILGLAYLAVKIVKWAWFA